MSAGFYWWRQLARWYKSIFECYYKYVVDCSCFTFTTVRQTRDRGRPWTLQRPRVCWRHGLPRQHYNRCRFKSEQLPGHRFGPWPADILAEDKAAKSWCRPPTTICFSKRQYSRQCGQFRLLGKSAVLGWPLPARYQQTHRPGLISYVCSAQVSK